MGQSLVMNYIHVIFSTKHRQPLITEASEKRLHAYIGAICESMESPALSVGGYYDHLHLLCRLSPKVSNAKLLQVIKSNSSRWMRQNILPTFAWQNGYGSFSVNAGDIENIKRYIERQHEHHATISFKDEYRKILKENDAVYDKQYIWL